MKTWTFNIDLFLRMDKVLDITFAEIARRTGVLQPALSRYTLQEFVIPIDTLIRLCNGLRMPFRYFVAEDGVSVIPEREHATVPRDEWNKIQWHGKQAGDVFYANHISWTKVADTMGLTKGDSAKKRFLNSKRFQIDDFLLACTKLQVSPWEFVTDTNIAAAKLGGAKQKPVRKVQQEPAEVKRLKDTVAELNARLDKLEKENDDMKKKMTSLLWRMEEMQQKTHRITNYGPVQENNFHIHKAAEPGEEQEPEA
jgi:seryl-tRNA synthetase